MIRRRRRAQEIAFSFDSFLDLVTNVVGIIIRLILVVWVGARSYSALKDIPRPSSDPINNCLIVATAAPVGLSRLPAEVAPVDFHDASKWREVLSAEDRLAQLSEGDVGSLVRIVAHTG